MSTAPRLSLTLAAAFALSACGPTPDGFCKQLNQALAANHVTCAGGSQAVYEKQFARSFICDDLKKAIDAKRVVYDGAKTADCVTALETQACTAQGVPAACKATVAGAVAVGGACYGGGMDCKDGSACKFTNNACPGTCVAWVVEGGDCSAAGADCDQGLYCDQVTKKCTANQKEGATCGSATGARCAAGLHCVSTSTGSGTCKAPSATAPCRTDSECGGKYACVGGSSGNGTCTALKPLGEACTPGKNECQKTLYCEGTAKKCTEWPSVPASCDTGSSGENLGCADGYCDSTTKKCTAFKAAGATCSQYSDECGATFCSGTTCPTRCAEI